MTAHIEVVSVNVRCPHCDEALYEFVPPVDPTPWGEQVKCWACRRMVQMPAYPFPSHRRNRR